MRHQHLRAAVFGSSVDYDFFVEFANAWGQQIECQTRTSSKPRTHWWAPAQSFGGNQSKPLFVGDGRTMDAAVDKMLEKVAARKGALSRRK